MAEGDARMWASPSLLCHKANIWGKNGNIATSETLTASQVE